MSRTSGVAGANGLMRSESFLQGRRPLRLLFLAGLTAVTLLPFSEKAFHIDDPLFVWAAKHITTRPLDPYGFDVNWYGTPMRMSEVTKNPPLTSYYIAGIAGLWGWHERALHLAFLIPAIAVILGTYLLAERLCARPILASLCALFTPVFLISSSTVMSDTIMLAFWMAAIYLWMTGLDKHSGTRLVLSGVAVALCALAKYFGMALIPMLFLYAVLRQRRVGWVTATLLVPVIILCAYQWKTHQLYGRGLLLDAASYATEMPSQWGKWSLAKLLIGMAFTGGCLGATWVFGLWRMRARALIAAAALAVAVTLWVGMTGRMGSHVLGGDDGLRWTTATLFGLFAAGGLAVLALAVAELRRRRDAESWLLFLWVAGTFVFAAILNWTTNGRSILPMVPAAAVLIVRRLEKRDKGTREPSMMQIAAGVAAAAMVAFAVGWADLAYAGSARQAAREIHEKYRDRTGRQWFEGHWGFQYYMEALGARAIDMKNAKFSRGDLIVVPENNTNVVPPPLEWARLLETVEVPSSRWIATMQPALGAGFYADVFGPLPFTVGKVPPERYRIFEVSPPSNP